MTYIRIPIKLKSLASLKKAYLRLFLDLRYYRRYISLTLASSIRLRIRGQIESLRS